MKKSSGSICSLESPFAYVGCANDRSNMAIAGAVECSLLQRPLRRALSPNPPSGTFTTICGASSGVVDSRVRVCGTWELRKVDRSIFAVVAKGNLQRCVHSLAEKAADLINEDQMV